MFNLLPIIAVVVSYFLGNISPAILIGKMVGIDIRNQGSGNAGTTNVLRVLGKKAAIATFLIDILKGAIAVLIGRYIGGQELALACGMAAFIGHIWPMIFGFKGGKGIATAFGIVLTVDPLLGLITCAPVFLLIGITKRVSVGSLVGAILFPISAYLFDPSYLLWALSMSVIVLITHRKNINRLFKGEEPKLTFKKKEEAK